VVEVQGADSQFVEASPRAAVAPNVPVRLILTPDQPGNLSVFDDARKLLFSTAAVAGTRYTVIPPPAERRFTVVLTPVATPAINSLTPTTMYGSADKGKVPGGRAVVTTIDLTRPQD
jgi:hypothetical protein